MGPGAAEGARWALLLPGAEMGWKSVYANVMEGDVWEWALTSIAGAHQAAGPAGHAFSSPLGVWSRISALGAGKPQGSSGSAFPSRQVKDLY